LDEFDSARDRASGTPAVETMADSASPICHSRLRLARTLSGVVLVQKRPNHV